ncbi:MAG: VIT domain-containing protein [Planctomycetota bacterium]
MIGRTIFLLVSIGVIGIVAVGCENSARRVASADSSQQGDGISVPSQLGNPPIRLSYGDDAIGNVDAPADGSPGAGAPSPVSLSLAVNPGEELWVIAKAGRRATSLANDDTPGSGSLVTTLPGETEHVPVPLEHTSVDGNVSGYVASVNVKQRFYNPYDQKIEAVYVFPLPQNAAVNSFVMTVGDRTIRGVIREREEAEQIYEQARSMGHVASLMTQERPNVFTQNVANIEPGKAIEVDITYFNTLAYSDGWFEFVFPMVVGPRFNPPSVGREGIGAVGRSGIGASGQGTEVAYLKPTERSGHDISLSVLVDPGVEIEEMRSTTHTINTSRESGTARKVELQSKATIPNKDFVLRYRVASDRVKRGIVVQPDSDGAGGYFTMMLVPPRTLEHVERAPVEFVFVLDCSGSMNGEPLDIAKQAVDKALGRMLPIDTFQIIRFSSNTSALGRRPLEATPENLARGRRYLQGLDSGGGTMMIEGIKAALDFPHDRSRQRYVTFLTDGYIGNEDEILQAVHRKLGDARVFSFGIGSSPNRFLMDRMAKAGRGAVAYVGLDDRADEIMGVFFDRVSHPALTDLEADWGALGSVEAYPASVPDLFVGRPVVITGRFDGTLSGLRDRPVRVTGRLPNYGEVALTPAASMALSSGGLDAVWARMKIESIQQEARSERWSDRRTAKAVRPVALEHGLMSAYTSFLAVDSLSKTEGGYGVTVTVPVPTPEGVRYSTSVASD